MKKYMLVIGVLSICMLLSACNKKADNNEDELLAVPEYQTQELTQAVSNKVSEYEIVEGYEIIPVNWAGDIVKFAVPYIENRVHGVYYHNDYIYDLAGKGGVSYSGTNCPEGASYIKQPEIDNSGFWTFSTLPCFGYNKGLAESFEEGVKMPELHLARELFSVYIYAENDLDADKMYTTPIKMSKCTEDVQCVTVALYEDFYEKRPDLTLKVYGVTNSVWEKYLGSEMTFSVLQEEQFMEVLKDSNYNECVLLGEREIAETGVYYIDIKELSKQGDFVQYILTADFSEAMEYSYRINCDDTYEIKAKEADLYADWKKEHKEQFIAGGEN